MINEEVAKKRALEEKGMTEAKTKGQDNQGCSLKKEKCKVVSSAWKGKAKRLFKKSDFEVRSSALENNKDGKEGRERNRKK